MNRSIRTAAVLLLSASVVGSISSCTESAAPPTARTDDRSPSTAATPGGSGAASSRILFDVPDPPAGTIDLSQLTGRIAFSAGQYPDVDLYVVNADGSGFTQLTSDDAAEFDPSWSPDGRAIAYRHQPGGEDTTSDIHVLDLATGSSHDVSGADNRPDWGPAWSPDGMQIAWNTAAHTRVGFDLGLVRPDGSGRREVRADVWVEYPAWSPDGRRIAFMSQIAEEGDQYDVFVMDADGSNVRRITNNRANDGWPTWSPDGSKIAFASTRDDCRVSPGEGCRTTDDIGPFQTLYTMAPDGSDQRRVSTLFAQLADWSPDGRYLVFEGSGGLTVVTRDGSAMATVDLPPVYPDFADWTR
jgi:Tol biopolymer transport system component